MCLNVQQTEGEANRPKRVVDDEEEKVKAAEASFESEAEGAIAILSNIGELLSLFLFSLPFLY